MPSSHQRTPPEPRFSRARIPTHKSPRSSLHSAQWRFRNSALPLAHKSPPALDIPSQSQIPPAERKMAVSKAERFLPLCPLLLLLLLLLLSAAAARPTLPAPDFIRRSCGKTLYPGLCCASLAPYAAAVQRDPVALAVAAANVSLARLQDASSLAASFQASSAGRAGAALRDCVQMLCAAADLTRQSTAEMGKLGNASKTGGTAWEASNAQTWMSAAMTNEQSCLDGFDGVKKGVGVRATCDRVGGVKKYTSNALALLNGLVNGS